jgi:hypothetical protein
LSSTNHGSSQKPTNTNFFSLHIDDRPSADAVLSKKAGTMVVETTERQVECYAVVTECGSQSTDHSSDAEHSMEMPRLVLVVSSVC